MVDHEIRQTPGDRAGFFSGYYVVIAAFFGMMIIFGAYHAFGVFFKPLLTEFGWTRAATSGAFSLSQIVHGMLGIFMGGLTDRLGPRVVLTLCGFIFGVGYLLMSQITGVWQLYLFYGLMIGTGLSGTWVPLMSTVARWFVHKRSLMSGIVQAGGSIGGLAVPLAAAHLISAYDWRTSYMVLGGVVLVVTITAAQFLKRDPAGIGQMPYGENKGGGTALKFTSEDFSLKKAVAKRQFWLLFLTFFCTGFCIFSVVVHIVPHGIDLGFSPTVSAGFLATLNGVSIIGRVVLGNAADRIGNKKVLIAGLALMSASCVWLVSASTGWQLYLFAVVFGFAYGGCTMTESPLTAALFGLGSIGLIYGFIVVGFNLGASTGPLLAGFIFDITSSYRTAFLLCAAASILGLIFAASLRPTGGGEARL